MADDSQPGTLVHLSEWMQQEQLSPPLNIFDPLSSHQIIFELFLKRMTVRYVKYLACPPVWPKEA
jgi:hypothetical protein